MEDLGHIDINIREMGGGGGGRGSGGGSGAGGTPGGGPALPSNALSTFGAAGFSQGQYQAQTASNIAGMRANLKGWQAGISALHASRAFMRGESFVELRDFFRGPTLAGFKYLTGNASATGTMLGKLAASSPRLAIWSMNLLGAAGVLTTFIRSMKSANEAIKDRISELTKYSSLLAMGAAREQLAQLNRDLRELHENGRMYAAAQELDTIAADQWADAMIGVRQIMAGMGAGFNLLKIGASGIVKGVSFLATWPFKLAGAIFDKYQIAFAGLNLFGNLKWMVGLGKWAAQFTGTGGIFGGMLDWLENLLKSIGGDVSKIKSNTAGKDLAGEVNDWFRSDVMAMTGRPY